ncbi:hypothetical protein, partial [Serratia marcescens]|uniref:hypothetical protein n=1 Tax=Serratia marcescens TaxID=615 RepID=UPI001953612E
SAINRLGMRGDHHVVLITQTFVKPGLVPTVVMFRTKQIIKALDLTKRQKLRGARSVTPVGHKFRS